MADLWDGESALTGQAFEAVRLGADPEWVRSKFLEQAAAGGMDPAKLDTRFLDQAVAARKDLDSNKNATEATPKVDKATKKDYENVVFGAGDPELRVDKNAVYTDKGTKGLLEQSVKINRFKDSPRSGDFSNVEKGVESTDAINPLMAAGYGIQGAIQKGAAGLLGAATPLKYLTPAGIVDAGMGLNQDDALFEASDKLRAAGEQSAKDAGEGKAAVVGGLLGSFVAPPLAEGFNRGADILKKGGSLEEAEKENAISGVENEAYTALGLLGPQAAGLAKRIVRTAIQSPAAGATAYLSNYLQGKETTKEDFEMALAMGAFGAQFRNERAAKKIEKTGGGSGSDLLDIPETGDAAFDAGVENAKKAGGDFDFSESKSKTEDIIKGRTEPEQTDLFTKDNEGTVQGDLLGGEAVSGVAAELARRKQRLANEKAVPTYDELLNTPDDVNAVSDRNPQRTPEQEAELEKGYILDQQDRLNQEANTPSSVEPPAQADLWNVGLKSVVEDKMADPNANAAMAQAFDEAGVRRGQGLQTENLFPDIREQQAGAAPPEPQVFEPSRNPTVEQPVPEQGVIPEAQPDLFNDVPNTGHTGPETKYTPYTETQQHQDNVVTRQAASRLEELTTKAQGNKEKGIAPQVLTKAERSERAWLNKNKEDPAALRAGPPKPKTADAPAKERSLEEALADAERRKNVLGKKDDDLEFPHGDELPFDRLPNGMMRPKETAKAATPEQLAPFRSTGKELEAQQKVHDFINSKGNAMAVLDGVKSLPAHLQSVVDKLKANPYARRMLANVKIMAVSAEDLLKSTDPNDHVVRPMLGRRGGKEYSIGNLGAYDPVSNTIRLRGAGFKSNAAGGHGLQPTTVVHEIMHGFTKHLLDDIEEGLIKDPHLIKAAKDLEALRKELEAALPDLTKDLSPALAKEVTYGTSNIHELMSVFYTDKEALGVIAKFKGAVSRIKEATLDLLGFKGKQERDYASRLMEAGDKILAYNPDKNAGGIPGLEQVPRRSEVAGHADDANTPQFKAWFGDSKVVDADGKPKTLYHGTSKDQDFTTFKVGKRGTWMTEDPKIASDYALDNESQGHTYDGRNFHEKHTASRVIPVHTRIENPYTITPADRERMNVSNYAKAQGQLFDELRAKGHDGVDMGDGVWVALKDANQIKSATGNSGEYSRAKGSIVGHADELPPQKAGEDNQSYLSKIVQNLKGKGQVAVATSRKEGEIAGGKLEAQQAANRLKGVVTDSNRADVGRALEGDVESFQKLDKATQEVVRNEFKQNVARSIDIAKSIMAIPKAIRTAEQEAIAHKALENAGKYQAQVYKANEVSGSMKAKYEQAQEAYKKLAAGKALTAEEKDAMDSVDIAKKFVENYYLPETDKLNALKTPHLEELYKYYTNGDPAKAFEGLSKDDRKQAMIASIAEGQRSITNRSGEIDNLLKAAMGIAYKKATLRQFFNNLRASSDVFSMKGNVPKELKQLWEPITDPVARNAASIAAQTNYLANLHAQNLLRERGMGKFFTADRGHGTLNAKIEGENMGSLKGLYTTPAIADAINSAYEARQQVGSLMEIWSSNTGARDIAWNYARWGAENVIKPAASWTKLMTVVYNFGNFANNFVGSGAQLVSNGALFHPKFAAMGMRDAAAAIGLGLKKNSSEAIKDLFKYHQMEYSHIQELQGSETGGFIKKLLSEAATKDDPTSYLMKALSKARDAAGHGGAIMKETYGAMDLWTKIANWHRELDFWTKYAEKNKTGETLDQIKQKVADRNNDTNISPGMAPKLLQGLERYGITRFGTYYSEVARTLYNNFHYGVQDVIAGIKAGGDKDLLVHGLNRIGGAGAALLAHNQHLALIAKGLAGAAGLVATQLPEGDPRRKMMEKDDFMSSFDPLLLTDPKHPEAGEFVYDISHADPYAPLSTPMKDFYQAAALAAEGKKDEALELAKKAGNNIIQLYHSNAMWGQVQKYFNESAPAMKKQSPETYEYLSEMLTKTGYISAKGADKILGIGEITSPRTAKNYYYNRNIESGPLRFAVQAGVGVQKLDAAGSMSDFTAPVVKSKITEAKAPYLDLMKHNYDSSPERLEKDFKEAIKKAAEPYDTLKTTIAAARAQGTEDRELRARLKEAGISQEMVGDLLRDKPLNVRQLAGDLKRDYQRDEIEAQDDPEKKSAARERMFRNQALMREFMNKYRNTTVEELD